MKLLDKKFGTLSRPGPNDGTSLVMDLEHVMPRPLLVETKDLSKDVGDVTHQVYRVVVDDNLPRNIKCLFDVRFGKVLKFCCHHKFQSSRLSDLEKSGLNFYF